MNDMQMIQEIERLKKEKNIRIFAHNYQNHEVQKIADYIGDSFYLSKLACDVDCDEIVFCGVRFMAETAKIMCMEKKVVLPVEDAECPMAHMVKPEEVLAFKKEHPEFKVVSYVNTTTELKAVSDVCVTSSIAERVINNMDGQDILFIPDMNLADYITKKVSGKNIISWNGCCPVHDKVRREEVLAMKKEYSGYEVLAHPECRKEVLQEADFVGSTSAIIDYAKSSNAPGFIIGTETGVLHTLRAENPEKEYELLSPSLICYNMKKTTLKDVYDAVIGNSGLVIELDEELAERAKKSLDEMVRLAHI